MLVTLGKIFNIRLEEVPLRVNESYLWLRPEREAATYMPFSTDSPQTPSSLLSTSIQTRLINVARTCL